MANEDIVDIPPNRTLIATRLTIDVPIKPQVVQGLQTIDEVFDHYNPYIKFEFENEAGKKSIETLKFKKTDDFSLNHLVSGSTFLRARLVKKDMYLTIVKHLNSDKKLREMITDTRKRSTLMNMLDAIVSQLQPKK